MKDLHVVIIVQARMGSTRLPGKIMKTVFERPLLSYLLERLRDVRLAKEIVIATTTLANDQMIVNFCENENVNFFRGAEENVLDRYYQAARHYKADVVVRITSDCPLIDPVVIDEVIDEYLKNYPSFDYVSNSLQRSFPRGMDVEVFSYKNLEIVHKEACCHDDKEHVTPFFYHRPERFKLHNVSYKKDESSHRWTVDTEEDFIVVKKILTSLYPKNPKFKIEEILELMKKHPQWSQINAHIKQKELKNVQNS